MSATERFLEASATARFVAIVVQPTPPFGLYTGMSRPRRAVAACAGRARPSARALSYASRTVATSSAGW